MSRRWRWILAALVVLPLLAFCGLAWLVSTAMVAPPRMRIDDSARPVIGIHGREDPRGVRVDRALDPARSAGVLAGDVVTAANGLPLLAPADLKQVVLDAAGGQPLTLTLQRAGAALELTVLPEERPVSPADQDLAYEPFSFVNAAGQRIDGWFLPGPGSGPHPLIAWGHGNGGDRRQLLYLGWEVHRAGFAQVLIDFAGRGMSDGDRITLGPAEGRDLCRALDVAADRPDVDHLRLAVGGRSMGAVAALLCAAQRPGLRAVVLDSPFADLGDLFDDLAAGSILPRRWLRGAVFGLVRRRAGYDPATVSPIAALPRTEAPILLVHGTEDGLIPFEHGERLAAAGGERVTFVPLPGLDHNTARPVWLRERIGTFLADNTEIIPSGDS